MRHYLLIANLTLGGDALWEQVVSRLSAGDCRFHVMVPATHDPLANTWSEEEATAAARQRLERTLTRLQELGAEATGEVGDFRAIDAALDALRAHSYDEVIVSTLPPTVSRWLRVDFVSRLRRAVDVPVTHVIGEPEHAGNR